MLWMYQRVFFGPVSLANRSVSDLRPREYAMLVPLILLMVWMGIYPMTFLKTMDASTAKIISDVETIRQQINPTIYRVSR